MYTSHQWETDIHFSFRYLRYLPKDFDENKKYPLVFFLHGAGEWGENLEDVARHGFLQHVRESGKEYPFIIVAPQCPAHQYWGCFTESLLAFLDYICESLPIDKERVYLTGLSMGGTGTWMLAMAAPERFAAIAPICGTGIYWFGEALVDIPIMIYHGDYDEIVPLSESISMVNSVNKRGGNAQIEICYGLGHNAWDIAYADDTLVNWFLQYRKKKD
ncbi:MAG: dienelactone hydrolase family protein [Clostridia bacterium]|nr:dienelactone hydrolase family protein [Clostridia bacterium]